MASNARPNSLGLRARAIPSVRFNAVAADCIDGMIGLLTGLSGFESAVGCEMLGHASLSTSSRFALSSGRKNVEPVTLASGLARLDTRPVATASPLMAITMGMVEVACLAARTGRSMRDEEINPRRNKLSYQFRESIVPFFRPAKLDSNVPALNVAEFTKAHSEHLYWLCRACGRRRAKKSNPRQPASRLLRPRRQRPRCRRAAEQRDELAPFHVWMAPAWQEIIWRAAQRSLAVSVRPVGAVRVDCWP